ncbi:hypothetical protein NE237_031399 [Protea cynaroides]|uniref:Reverse transcriptase n=1 Tax=Protea cynaroides TaxID=273540 RepID=A0A9Q0R2G5_9MAGN|nr:hypothetical protein NE237_031399 [Protea cynaroides]
MWMRHDDCANVVEKCWRLPSSSSPAESLHAKTKSTEEQFFVWNKKVFGRIKHNIDRLKRQLIQIQQHPLGLGSEAKEKEVMEQLEEKLLREELLWKQKSHVEWLRSGDLNMAYFHATIITRQSTNRILQIKLPSVEEIRRAAFAMSPLKSPGPDGLPPAFYHKFWDKIGANICRLHLWKEDLLQELFQWKEIKAIRQIPLRHFREEDQLVWTRSRDDGVPTSVDLQRHNIKVDVVCKLCGRQAETITHVKSSSLPLHIPEES